jgi:hypothetical protein
MKNFIALKNDTLGHFFCDFYVMFQRENHFINKRLQKPRLLNLKCIPAVNTVNKTNRNRYNSVLKILCNFFFCQLNQLLLLTLYNVCCNDLFFKHVYQQLGIYL